MPDSDSPTIIFRSSLSAPTRVFKEDPLCHLARIEASIYSTAQRYEELVASINGIVWEADARTFQFAFVSQRVAPGDSSIHNFSRLEVRDGVERRLEEPVQSRGAG